MKIQRFSPPKPTSRLTIACGCLTFVFVFAVSLILVGIVLMPLLPSLVLQISGFEKRGAIANFAATDSPIPPLENARSAGTGLQVDLPSGRQINLNQGTYSAMAGNQGGAAVLQVDLTAEDLLNLCQQFSDFCSPDGGQIRNGRFELRSGLLLLHSEVYISQINTYQPVSLVLQAQGQQSLSMIGLDVNGELYAIPDNELGQFILQGETALNDLLSNLSVITETGTYRLTSLYLNQDRLIVQLRG